MKIELVDGEDEIIVTGLDAFTAMATDGHYVSAEKYAEKNGLSDSNIRNLKRRNKVEAITIFGRSYIKKECKPNTRKYQKKSQKTCKSANPEEHQD